MLYYLHSISIQSIPQLAMKGLYLVMSNCTKNGVVNRTQTQWTEEDWKRFLADMSEASERLAQSDLEELPAVFEDLSHCLDD